MIVIYIGGAQFLWRPPEHLYFTVLNAWNNIFLGGDSDDERSQGQIQAAREKPGQFKSQAYVEDSSSDEDFNPSKKMDSSDDEKEKPNKSQAMLSSSDDEAPARKMESSDDENTTKKLG